MSETFTICDVKDICLSINHDTIRNILQKLKGTRLVSAEERGRNVFWQKIY